MDDLEKPTRYKTLSNGAVYDLEEKRIVSGAIITSDRARELVNIREQKRREIAREAANAAVQRGDFTAKHGEMAFFAEIVSAAQSKATNIDDPKMIEAARFVLAATGESVDGQQNDSNGSLSEARGLVRDLAELGRVIISARKVE